MERLAQETKSLLNITLTKRQRLALRKYEQELIDWNKRYNLTAINKPNKIRRKHFLDSFTAAFALRDSKIDRVIDVGTGAGFPGIPLKIIFPQMTMVLLESVGKKVEFCQHIIDIIGLEGINIIKGRAEAIGKLPAHREKYDWAIARAVANLSILSEYLLPLVRVGGKVLAMKGESGLAEAHTAENAINLLGGKLQQLIPVSLPGVVEERYLIVIDKVATTPKQYPRRIGIPKKRPLE
ncbi:MAG: 16S rRNA (guanine(527)-N(7))-methyltransferase RsmG [Anaerolineales bacterium]|nr:16S rRNA (guanine(527)-N(7))-methyltransferase RsmG [Anaerolineales bacterium]